MKIENVYIISSINKITHEMTLNNSLTAEQKLRETENKLVNIITSLSYLKGRSTKTAKIIAHIYIRRKATQKLLREITGYSLGTISNTLKFLEKIGIIHKTQDPQTREYIYEFEGTIGQSGSRSIVSTFEYFSQLEEFLKKTKLKLDQPHLSNKKGFENVNQFINKMSDVFSAMEQTIQKVLTPLLDENGMRVDR